MTVLKEESGKTSWLRVMATIWVLLCGVAIAAALLQSIDLPTNVLSMLQTGFGALVVGYIGNKVATAIAK